MDFIKKNAFQLFFLAAIIITLFFVFLIDVKAETGLSVGNMVSNYGTQATALYDLNYTGLQLQLPYSFSLNSIQIPVRYNGQGTTTSQTFSLSVYKTDEPVDDPTEAIGSGTLMAESSYSFIPYSTSSNIFILDFDYLTYQGGQVSLLMYAQNQYWFLFDYQDSDGNPNSSDFDTFYNSVSSGLCTATTSPFLVIDSWGYNTGTSEWDNWSDGNCQNWLFSLNNYLPLLYEDNISQQWSPSGFFGSLSNRIPFGYFEYIYDKFDALRSATTTDDLDEYSLVIPVIAGLTTTTTTMPFFSSSLLFQFLPESSWDFLKLIFIGILWIAWAFHAIKHIKSIFNINPNQ